MGKSISLPFLPLPEIGINNEQAFDYLLENKILKYRLPNNEFIYIKLRLESRFVFIFSRDKLFKLSYIFCIARDKEHFVKQFHRNDLFYFKYL